MPVWHERTREAREAGELLLIGITEEQHLDRCALFAQWQELDWPILWDPFNLTESAAVPVAVAVDEHGIVRHVGLAVGDFEEFLFADFDAPGGKGGVRLGVREEARGPKVLEASTKLSADQAMSRLLWGGGSLGPRDFAACIAALEGAAEADDAPPSALFRLGVAERLRYDSAASSADDFQASLDHWSAALRADPRQYIWRRRIQQWGPRLDKPYPFYDWVAQATREVRERGEEPLPVRVALTTSEVSGRGPARPNAQEGEAPDPGGRIARDHQGWVALETAVAPHTDGRGDGALAAQVHLVLRPSRDLDVHWTNDAGPTTVWIEDAEAWGLARPAFTLPMPKTTSSAETRRVDFAVTAEPDAPALRGIAYYYVCEGKAGECRFLAQPFELELP